VSVALVFGSGGLRSDRPPASSSRYGVMQVFPPGCRAMKYQAVKCQWAWTSPGEGRDADAR
jgi:hypothetical protein